VESPRLQSPTVKPICDLCTTVTMQVLLYLIFFGPDIPLVEIFVSCLFPSSHIKSSFGFFLLSLVTFSVTVIKHSDQKQIVGRKGFVWLTVPGHSPSLMDARAGTQART